MADPDQVTVQVAFCQLNRVDDAGDGMVMTGRALAMISRTDRLPHRRTQFHRGSRKGGVVRG
jgi:hypothetical protein